MNMLASASQKVCTELTPKLQSYAQEFGLPADLAHSLSLTWDGETFSAVSAKSLDTAEYGDGTGPAPRPVHKALNRLEIDAEALLNDLMDASIESFVEGLF